MSAISCLFRPFPSSQTSWVPKHPRAASAALMLHVIPTRHSHLESQSSSAPQPDSPGRQHLCFLLPSRSYQRPFHLDQMPERKQFLRLLKTSPKLPLMFRMQVNWRSEKLSYDSHTQVKYSFLQFLGRPGYGRADSPRLFLSSLCLFSHPGLSSFSVKETSGLFFKGNSTEWLKEKMIPDGPEKAQCAHSPPVTALPEGHTMRSKVIPHKRFAMLN